MTERYQAPAIILKQERQEQEDQFKNRCLFPDFARRVSELASSRGRGLSLLDLGTGSGQLGRFLKEEDIKYAALVDTNPLILRKAVQTYSQRGVSVASFARSVTELLPLRQGSLDVVIASFLFNQIKDFELAFDLTHSYLRPTGEFIVVVPDEAFIAVCSQTQPDKFGEIPSGVLHQIATTYYFRGADYQVPFIARPNTYYSSLMGMAGFLVKEFRVEDPFEPAFKNTPKALMLVGYKIPTIISAISADRTLAQVRITNDVLGELRLRAITKSENESWINLVTEDDEGQLVVLPFPTEEKYLGAFAKVSEIVYEDDATLLVRRVRLEDSRGNSKSMVRIYHQGEKLAHYVYTMSAA